MPDYAGVFLIGGAVVIATVALLAIGTAFGYRFGLQGGSRLVAIAPTHELANSDLIEQVKIYHELAHVMKERSGTVIRMAAPHFQSLPPSFKQAIDGLVEATKQLGLQLERFGAVTTDVQVEPVTTTSVSPSPSIRQPESTQERESSAATVARPASALTSEEIARFAESGNAADSRSRYPYSCEQTVYPCYEDREHATSSGIPVRCRDISAQGIAFLMPENPDFERLIISLGGVENPILMGAAVQHSRSVFMNGQVQVLVGCKFTGRVPSQKQKRINTSEAATSL